MSSIPWLVHIAKAGLADKAARAAEEAKRTRSDFEDFIPDLGEWVNGGDGRVRPE
ncbi:MAG: hypothetical protein ACLPPF_23580 [Rhodomicrobium sp.]